MKKVFFALVCMAGLSMMTACGGDKKGEKADAEKEKTEEVAANDEQNADEPEAEPQEEEQADVWGDPAKAADQNLAELYAAGDFKPAATVIFEDTMEGETVGELPSKWDVLSGSAEIAEAQDIKYITMLSGDAQIRPLAQGDGKNFLPEKYTMEFQFMFGRDVFFFVNFLDAEENGVGDYNMWLCNAEWHMCKSDDDWISGNQSEFEKMLNRDGWNHFAVSYDKGNMKIFINGKRIANLPNIKQAAYFVVRCDGADGKSHYIKNVRVAK